MCYNWYHKLCTDEKLRNNIVGKSPACTKHKNCGSWLAMLMWAQRYWQIRRSCSCWPRCCHRLSSRSSQRKCCPWLSLPSPPMSQGSCRRSQWWSRCSDSRVGWWWWPLSNSWHQRFSQKLACCMRPRSQSLHRQLSAGHWLQECRRRYGPSAWWYVSRL